MTSKFSALLSLAIVASSTTIATAGWVPSFTLRKDPANGLPFSAPDAALGSPWVSYLLSIDTTNTGGELMQAFQVTITGALHQRWIDSDADEIFEPTATTVNVTSGLANGDSHLLAQSGSLFGSGPTEDNPGTGSPLTSTVVFHYGVGTQLSGAWARLTATTTANLAYIVVQKGLLPNLNIEILVADPTGKLIAQVPEPTSALLTIFGLAGLAAARPRRKR